MRVPEGLGAEIWRRAGVGVVTLPGSEVYTALERGVIEATDWGTLGMNNDLGYHKIAKYPMYPGFHSMPCAEVAVNLTKWNALSPDLKAILEISVRDFARDMVQRIAMEDINVAAQAKAAGIELVNWPPEERLKFRQLAEQSWADWAKKSPTAKRVYDSQVAFLKKLQLL
jgi:TRAP-type mannitol/chloroaromatic compound transport system substrate-binding protein